MKKYDFQIQEDKSGKFHKVAYEENWITNSKLKVQNKVATIDPLEICCEIYNPNKYIIIFESYHPIDTVKKFFQNGPYAIKCLPDSHCFLPHQYYKGWIEFIGNKTSGQIAVIKNMGNTMFVGNKKVSRPE